MQKLLSTMLFLLHRPRRDDAGQATAEYALVLIAAATVATIVLVWATKTNLIGGLLDAVFDNLLGRTR